MSANSPLSITITALAAASAALLAACASAPAPAAASPAAPTPATRALAAACAGRDGWGDPAPPATLFANVHYVGSCGITALLITSPRGHVLIDGAVAEAAPHIAANIRALGFALGDVKVILSTHEHHDHVGGLAELQRLTGARVLASPEAAKVLASGVIGPDDPQAGLPGFAPVRVDRTLRDGEVVRVGPLALTARFTPGHALGGTSWTWRACDGALCKAMVYADSLNPVANRAYRFTDHPDYVAGLRRSIATVAAFDCDVLVTPHPSGSALFERLAGTAPLEDRTACARYAQAAAQRLDARLASEEPPAS